MLSPEILEKRRQGIAASDAAPIMNLSPWKSPADVWIEKKHPHMIEPKKSKALYWGTRLERIIADEYAQATNQKLEPGGFQHNSKCPWIMCQPDNLIDGKKKGLECKTASGFDIHDWGPSGTDRVPTHYMFQIFHSMIVMNYREWDLAVLIGGSDFRIYHLFWDNDLVKELWETEKEFYERYIKGNETPEFDWGNDLSSYVQKKFPKGDKSADSFDVDAHGSSELKCALESLLIARDAQDAAEADEVKYKTLIQAYMGTRSSLVWQEKNLRITWNNQKDSVKIDREAILEKLLPTSTLDDDGKKALIQANTDIKTGVRRFVVYDGKKKANEE